jgi:hypothetical protein
MMSWQSRPPSGCPTTSPTTPKPSHSSPKIDDVMAQVRLRVRGDSVNQLIIDALAAEIERVRSDDDFTARAKKLLERDREILDRLAK